MHGAIAEAGIQPDYLQPNKALSFTRSLGIQPDYLQPNKALSFPRRRESSPQMTTVRIFSPQSESVRCSNTC